MYTFKSPVVLFFRPIHFTFPKRLLTKADFCRFSSFHTKRGDSCCPSFRVAHLFAFCYVFCYFHYRRHCLIALSNLSTFPLRSPYTPSAVNVKCQLSDSLENLSLIGFVCLREIHHSKFVRGNGEKNYRLTYGVIAWACFAFDTGFQLHRNNVKKSIKVK